MKYMKKPIYKIGDVVYLIQDNHKNYVQIDAIYKLMRGSKYFHKFGNIDNDISYVYSVGTPETEYFSAYEYELNFDDRNI